MITVLILMIHDDKKRKKDLTIRVWRKRERKNLKR